MKPIHRVAVAAILLLSACGDQQPLVPVPPPAPATPGAQSTAVECIARVRDGSVACAAPAPKADARAVIMGGQNTYVKVISSNVAYDSATALFTADFAVQNLLKQALGTADGVNADPEGVRVFFTSGPVATAGNGAVSVANADGTAAFTAAGQPFFRYPGILAPGGTTASKPWRFNVPKTVLAFAFLLYLDVRVEPRLAIDEIMAHPTTASEAAGEWIEIYNAGVGSVDLKGWTVASGGDAGYTIDTSLVLPTHGYAVLAGSTDLAQNDSIPANDAWTGLSLGNDTTDWLALRTPGGITVDSVSWGAAAGDTPSPPPTGIARQLLSPDSSHVDLSGAASRWTNAAVLYARTGQRGTPGARNRLGVSGVALAAGSLHTCLADARGQAWCWGSLDPSNTGATRLVANPPAAVAQGSAKLGTLAAGGDETCASDYFGQPMCWGTLFGATPSRLLPLPAAVLTQVDVEGVVACGVSAEGTAYCWRAQYAVTVYGNSYPGGPLPTPGAVSRLALGGAHLCVVSGGAVYCTGSNDQGQLGTGNRNAVAGYAQAQLPAGVTAAQVTAGGNSTCALSTGGQAYCWGSNLYGELGTGSSPSGAVPTPTAVKQPAGVTFTSIQMAMAPSYLYFGATTCALAGTGQAYCWGSNVGGRLGDGTTSQRLVPTPVFQPALSFSSVAVGGSNTCALETDTGNAYCWGLNYAGQVGDGTFSSPRLTPTAVIR